MTEEEEGGAGGRGGGPTPGGPRREEEELLPDWLGGSKPWTGMGGGPTGDTSSGSNQHTTAPKSYTADTAA